MKHKGIIKLLCAAIFGVFCLSLATSCAEKKPQGIVVGAENFDAYLPLLEGKRVALFGSYDWNDGEWMELWEQRAEDAGLVVVDSVIAKDYPDDDASADCMRLGSLIAQ